MGEPNVNLEQELAAFDKEFQEATPLDNWMPPDGEYIVDITDVKAGTRLDKKTSAKVLDVKVMGRIRPDCVAGDEKLAGATFQLAWWSSRTFGMMKAALRVLNGGEPFTGSLNDGIRLVTNSKGMSVKVKVGTRKGDKGEFRTCDILDLIEIAVPTAA